ncbi:MAG: rod shape-determining protein MreD [Candidatus Eiseniibacteriota bacterium]
MRALGAFLLGMVLVLLLRSTALSPLAARGIVIDALAFATVFWALRYGAVAGASFGFMIGLAADLDATHWMGRHALVLSIIGYAIGRLARTLVRDSARTQLVLIGLAVAVHQAWVVPFELGGLEGLGAGWPYLFGRVLVSALATAPLGALVLITARRLTGRSVFGHALANPG